MGQPRSHWHLITGEYPPHPGGVSDYTAQLTQGLAKAGEQVHVWAPAFSQPLRETPGVQVHELRNGFTPKGLLDLSKGLDSTPGPRRLLIQYVPTAFGLRGMNVPFCLWLAARRLDRIWLMFHEVAFPWNWRDSWKHQTLALVTRIMGGISVVRADHLFVSTLAWRELLYRFPIRIPEPIWLPIPSNLPTDTSLNDSQGVRHALLGNREATVLGHFGTYGSLITPLLEPTLNELLSRDHRRVAFLVGRGSDQFAARFAQLYPALASQVFPSKELLLTEAANWLRACDVMLQPYPDGITTRRTSALATMGLGLPLVTNQGPLTEPEWRLRGGVALAENPDSKALVETVENLLQNPETWAPLARRGREVYDLHYSLERTLQTLLHLARAENAG